MESTTAMIRSHPRPDTRTADAAAIAQAIESVARCAIVCSSCADACLGEADVASLTRCIRLNLDCADVCTATAALLSRQTQTEHDVVRRQLEACVVACRACGTECERHAAHMEHCRICAEACRACERACQTLLDASRG